MAASADTAKGVVASSGAATAPEIAAVAKIVLADRAVGYGRSSTSNASSAWSVIAQLTSEVPVSLSLFLERELVKAC